MLIAIASVSGSPGVTTTAVGLSLVWPQPVVLVDGDPHPSQAVQAGFLCRQWVESNGLNSVIQWHRQGEPLARNLESLFVPLGSMSGQEADFIPGFNHPKTAELFGPVWPDLVAALTHFSDSGRDVIVDCGRVSASGLPEPLVAAADLVLLVTKTSLPALAALQIHQGELMNQISLHHKSLKLVLSGGGKPYSRTEIERQFGLGVIGEVIHDPAKAAVLSEGRPASSRFSRSKLVSDYVKLADEIKGLLTQQRDRIGVSPNVLAKVEANPEMTTRRDRVGPDGADVESVADGVGEDVHVHS